MAPITNDSKNEYIKQYVTPEQYKELQNTYGENIPYSAIGGINPISNPGSPMYQEQVQQGKAYQAKWPQGPPGQHSGNFFKQYGPSLGLAASIFAPPLLSAMFPAAAGAGATGALGQIGGAASAAAPSLTVDTIAPELMNAFVNAAPASSILSYAPEAAQIAGNAGGFGGLMSGLAGAGAVGGAAGLLSQAGQAGNQGMSNIVDQAFPSQPSTPQINPDISQMSHSQLESLAQPVSSQNPGSINSMSPPSLNVGQGAGTPSGTETGVMNNFSLPQSQSPSNGVGLGIGAGVLGAGIGSLAGGMGAGQGTGAGGATSAPSAPPGATQGGLGNNPVLSGLLGGGPGVMQAFDQGNGLGNNQGNNQDQNKKQQQQQPNVIQTQPFGFNSNNFQFGNDAGGMMARIRKMMQLQEQNNMIQPGASGPTQIGQPGGIGAGIAGMGGGKQ